MRTGQTLFPLRIEFGIPWVRPWKELLATGTQTTWLYAYFTFPPKERKINVTLHGEIFWSWHI